MSRTTLPVCPKTGSTSPSLTVHLCLHTALLREIGNAPLDHGPSAAQREKALADFEADCEEDLAAARTMARLGPMLGLMGTLIPMGPALVGLAAGDIAAMAENLQVAFSTTVVGLFVGGVGFAVQQAKQRWHGEALNDLEFVSGLIGERTPTQEEGGPDGRQETAAATRPRAS